MRPPFSSSLPRIGVRPDDPRAIVGPRRPKSRRPHTDATVAVVRHLIESTALTYGEIAAKTGVGRASICRWTRDGGWTRHPFAPRATDTIRRVRASAHLRMRTLAARLAALAERYVRELEETPGVDLDKLAEALALMQMAKLAARPKRRGVKAAEIEAMAQTFAAGPRDVLRGLRGAGVDTLRAPEAAVMDFVESRAPPPERPPRQTRRRARSSAEWYAWLREKE
jgi:hypothetical protein